MLLDYVPLLQTARDLLDIPRGRARFGRYLQAIMNDEGLQRPTLVAMNPMSKEHVTAQLDTLLSMDADGIAARATAEAATQLRDAPGYFKIGLVIADDLKGGWTNRYANEFDIRFRSVPTASAAEHLPRWLQSPWLSAVLWSSEQPSAELLRQAILSAAHRSAYVERHGLPRTLRAMMLQEGHVMAAAGCATPALEDDDLEYTRAVLVDYLDADDQRTAMECLFGDGPGRTLGLTPRGLSSWAGLALALHDARAASTS
jgi:hypothetical protein